jgi:hypothetical protein
MSRKRQAAAIALLACVLGLTAAPAQAGFFERLFGGFTRHLRPPVDNRNLPEMSPIPGDRVSPQGGEDGSYRPRSENGPHMAFCVRTCDGHYFPVHAHAGFSAAQMCQSFCPASETKLYSGGGIDHASASDGSHYADLPQAFAYRKKLVEGCTCNGRDAFGLARIDSTTDPTLQRGDVVATSKGMMAVSGKDERGPQFTPVDGYRGFSEGYRQTLADMENASRRGAPARPPEGPAPADRD